MSGERGEGLLRRAAEGPGELTPALHTLLRTATTPVRRTWAKRTDLPVGEVLACLETERDTRILRNLLDPSAPWAVQVPGRLLGRHISNRSANLAAALVLHPALTSEQHERLEGRWEKRKGQLLDLIRYEHAPSLPGLQAGLTRILPWFEEDVQGMEAGNPSWAARAARAVEAQLAALKVAVNLGDPDTFQALTMNDPADGLEAAAQPLVASLERHESGRAEMVRDWLRPVSADTWSEHTTRALLSTDREVLETLVEGALKEPYPAGANTLTLTSLLANPYLPRQQHLELLTKVRWHEAQGWVRQQESVDVPQARAVLTTLEKATGQTGAGVWNTTWETLDKLRGDAADVEALHEEWGAKLPSCHGAVAAHCSLDVLWALPEGTAGMERYRDQGEVLERLLAETGTDGLELALQLLEDGPRTSLRALCDTVNAALGRSAPPTP